MQTPKISSSQPFFSFAVAAALGLTVLITFGALFGAVSTVQTFL
jgi:hypothetical protein